MSTTGEKTIEVTKDIRTIHVYKGPQGPDGEDGVGITGATGPAGSPGEWTPVGTGVEKEWPISSDIMLVADSESGDAIKEADIGNIPAGAVPTFDDDSFDSAAWREFQTLLYKSVRSGTLFS